MSLSPKGNSPMERRPSDQNFGLHQDALFDLRDRLLFAVPKKGRLHEQCIDLLARIGLKYSRKPRLDVALCTNMNVALVFLPAADIPRYIADSNVDIGITGEDMIAEHNNPANLKKLVDLGFGKCRLCIQAPVAKQYTKGEDLVGQRIVTSFPNLTKRYFEKLPKGEQTKISYVSGSVEVACGLGLADGIVDLVESGETMVAHSLGIVDVLMHTQAVLVCNAGSNFPKMIEKINRRVQGVVAAKKYRMITYNICRKSLESAKKITPGQRAPTVMPLEGEEDWVAVQAMVTSSDAHEMMDSLHEIGAVDILLTEIANTRFTMSKDEA